jgi:hypothetical protein
MRPESDRPEQPAPVETYWVVLYSVAAWESHSWASAQQQRSVYATERLRDPPSTVSIGR